MRSSWHCRPLAVLRPSVFKTAPLTTSRSCSRLLQGNTKVISLICYCAFVLLIIVIIWNSQTHHGKDDTKGTAFALFSLCVSPLPSRTRYRLCLVFPPSRPRHRFCRVCPTAVATKALPLPCVSTAFAAAKTAPFLAFPLRVLVLRRDDRGRHGCHHRSGTPARKGRLSCSKTVALPL